MEVYDLFVPIGPACRPAYHLGKYGLREDAFPLDWQMGYSLVTVMHLFQTSFADFFLNIEERQQREGASNNRWVTDSLNHIDSIHHFSKAVSLEEAKLTFLTTMGKRFERLNDKLQTAARIALVANRKDSIEDLRSFLLEFSRLYPMAIIKMINIRDNSTLMNGDFYVHEFSVSDKIFLEEYIFNDSINHVTGENFDWRGNLPKWKIALKKYTTTTILGKMKKMMNEKAIVIYGAGKRCLDVISVLDKYGVSIDGIAVTDVTKNPEKIGSIGVSSIEEYCKDSLIIISVTDKDIQHQIKSALVAKGYLKYVIFEEIVPYIN